jgi:hypothetical protein
MDTSSLLNSFHLNAAAFSHLNAPVYLLSLPPSHPSPFMPPRLQTHPPNTPPSTAKPATPIPTRTGSNKPLHGQDSYQPAKGPAGYSQDTWG